MDIFYVQENTNLYEYLIQREIDIKSIYEQIDIISKKQKNNKVGYFQFKSDNEYFKICVLPKSLKYDDDIKKLNEQFLSYLLKSYEVMSKNNKEEKLFKKIKKNYVDIINCKSSSTDNDLNVDKLLYIKYVSVLEEMYIKLKKIYFSSNRLKLFKDKSIKGKLDVKRSVLEINKSIIHQSTREEIYYDETIDIVHYFLKYFIKRKLNAIKCEPQKSEINEKTKRIITLIESKFFIEKKYFKLDNLLKQSTRNLFKKKKIEDIYGYLLWLMDLEGYFDCGNYKDSEKKIIDMISICFDPAVIYEYIVLEGLREENGDNVKFKDKVYSDYISYVAYKANERYEDADIKTSNPDFIIKEDGNNKVVLDAKWKIINKPSDVSEEDINKLRRDCIHSNVSKGILVYPKINFDYKDFYWESNLDNSDEKFKVTLKQVDIDN